MKGVLESLGRGVFRLASMPDFSEPDLVLVAKRIPQGIVCLISALAYYELTTQIPHFVYIALPRTSRLASNQVILHCVIFGIPKALMKRVLKQFQLVDFLLKFIISKKL